MSYWWVLTPNSSSIYLYHPFRSLRFMSFSPPLSPLFKPKKPLLASPHWTFLLPFYLLPAQKRHSAAVRLGFWSLCPKFPWLQLSVPTRATALFSAQNYYFISCSLLLQVFMNVTAIIRCRWWERWRHSADVLLANIYVPWERFFFFIKLLLLCFQRTNGMSWGNYSGTPDLRSNSCYR